MTGGKKHSFRIWVLLAIPVEDKIELSTAVLLNPDISLKFQAHRLPLFKIKSLMNLHEHAFQGKEIATVFLTAKFVAWKLKLMTLVQSEINFS